MLERIAEDPTRVQTPVIEAIDAGSFAMAQTRTQAICKGVFGWNMGFNWAVNFDPYTNAYKKICKYFYCVAHY